MLIRNYILGTHGLCLEPPSPGHTPDEDAPQTLPLSKAECKPVPTRFLALSCRHRNTGRAAGLSSRGPTTALLALLGTDDDSMLGSRSTAGDTHSPDLTGPFHMAQFLRVCNRENPRGKISSYR